MDKKFAVFDMDGTLVDSMPYWRALPVEFLRGAGVTGDLTEILEKIRSMTVPESVELFRTAYDLPGTPEEIQRELNAVMEDHYRNDVPLKPGVKEALLSLKEKGVSMCVASATPNELVEVCLSRLGVRDLFSFVMSCEEVGAGKHQPDIFLAAADRLGASAGEVCVYEDAYFAVKTAVEAGFYTAAVYDPAAEAYWEEICRMADETITDWRNVK